MMNSDWVRENERRVAYMDFLVKVCRRDDPSHPRYATFTGLIEERKQQLLEHDREGFLSRTG
jgi:hypothetical protein